MITLSKPALDVGLVPHDVDAMMGYYRDVIGFARGEDMKLADGELRRFVCGASTLKLYCCDQPPPRHPSGVDAGTGYRLLTLVIPSLDDVEQRAVAARLPPMQRERYEGTALGFTSDPDGNMLELVEAPVPQPLLQVGMTVADVGRTRDFYAGVLGLEEEPPLVLEDFTRYAVRFGESTLKFWTRGRDLPALSGPITAAAGIRYITAWVTDVDDLYRRLTAAGTRMLVPLTDLGGVARLFIAADPDGNCVEFVAALGSTRRG